MSSKRKSGANQMMLSMMRDELQGATDLLSAQTAAGLDKSDTLGSLYASTKNRLDKLTGLKRSEITELTTIISNGP